MMNQIVKASVLTSLCLGLLTLSSCCGTRCAPRCQAPCEPVPYQPAPYNQCAPCSPCAMPEPYMMQPVPTMVIPCEPSPSDYAYDCQNSPYVSQEMPIAAQCDCVAAPVTHDHNQNANISQEICEQSVCGHCIVLPIQNPQFQSDSQTVQAETDQEANVSHQ